MLLMEVLWYPWCANSSRAACLIAAILRCLISSNCSFVFGAIFLNERLVKFTNEQSFNQQSTTNDGLNSTNGRFFSMNENKSVLGIAQ
jgi:hypothetical protein